MKLDVTKPYATVHGSESGCAFEQDGRVFDAAGNEMPEFGVKAASMQASEMTKNVKTLHLPKK